MLRVTRLLIVGMIAGLVVIVTPQASTLASPGTSIAGGGIVTATDDFGGVFSNAGQLSISAGVRPDGTPYGSLNLVGRGDFAAAWGACPYDPRCEPNTSTLTFHLSGIVNSVTTAGSNVIVSGTLTESDKGRANGEIFHEDNVDFSLVATEGSQSVWFQFCFVPPFTLAVANGELSVSASTPQSRFFTRPAQRPAALQCHRP